MYGTGVFLSLKPKARPLSTHILEKYPYIPPMSEQVWN